VDNKISAMEDVTVTTIVVPRMQNVLYIRGKLREL